MPFNDPSLMTDEQKWAVVAYVLANHGALKPSDTLVPANAPSIAIKPPQAAAPAAPAPVQTAAATSPAQDTSAGERSWAKCRTCHQLGPAARNGIGPQLNGLFGRIAGSVEGYSYSPANKASGLIWDDEGFARYIRDPRTAMPGTKMIFAGIKNEQEIRDLGAYLKQFDGSGKRSP